MVTTPNTRCFIASATARSRTGISSSTQPGRLTRGHKDHYPFPCSLIVRIRTEAETLPRGAGCQEFALEPARVKYALDNPFHRTSTRYFCAPFRKILRLYRSLPKLRNLSPLSFVFSVRFSISQTWTWMLLSSISVSCSSQLIRS